MDNPHVPIPQANLAPGLAAIQRAKALNPKTERERDYIEALALMYADHDKLSHRERMRLFRDALAKMAAKYPDDDEAQIAYAITLNTSADLNDKTYAQQLKGAAILEPISKRLPQHPGVTHYKGDSEPYGRIALEHQLVRASEPNEPPSRPPKRT